MTYDFAYPGATVDSSIVASTTYPVISMLQQFSDLYLPNYSSRNASPHWTREDSLFVFFIGINDIGFSYLEQRHTRTNALIFGEFKRVVDHAYRSGARNFLFLMVPPINRAPLTTQLDSRRPFFRQARAIADWNRRLVNLAVNLTRTYDDATSFVFDTNGLFNQILDDPKQYEQTRDLVMTSSYCPLYSRGTSSMDTLLNKCQVPVDQYFWLNSLHPTFPVHNAMASEIAKMLSQTSYPSVWQSIAGGRFLWM